MIIPETEETIINIYHCPKCDKYYQAQTGGVHMGCLVNHPPDSCCHYNEREISKKKMKKLKKQLND